MKGYLLVKMRQGKVIEVHEDKDDRKVVVEFPTEAGHLNYCCSFSSETLNIGDEVQEICEHEQNHKLLKADAVLHSMFP